MNKLRVLHLEDNQNDVLLVRSMFEQSGIDAEITVVSSVAEYLSKIEHRDIDLILSDDTFSGMTGKAALEAARKHCPKVPFIFVSSNADEAQIMDRLNSGASDYVLKNNLWQLAAALRRIRKSDLQQTAIQPQEKQSAPLRKLTVALQELAATHKPENLMPIICRAARAISGADGAALILREGDECYCACEDSIAPLWKGKRFPISICPGNWTQSESEGIVVEDIRSDSRIGTDMYRSTFVKSVALVPLHSKKSPGMIGCFWAKHYHATHEQMELLKALAAAATAALDNGRAQADLKRQLAAADQELDTLHKNTPYIQDDPQHALHRH